MFDHFIKACASAIDLEVGVLLEHGESLCLVFSYFEHIG